jgi:hypothetical protein
MSKKARFTATPLAAVPDGWEKDWTLILRVPPQHYAAMHLANYLKNKQVTIELTEVK